jgi:hypothetical protein
VATGRTGELAGARSRAEGALPAYTDAELSSHGRSVSANGSLARLFWRVFDDLDYWLLTQSRLWLADAVCGPGAAGSG